MNRILIANRGEIALRVMRTVKKMGIQTIAVFSDADRNAPHVRFADEAVYLGPGPSSQSYLKADKIIEQAKKLEVDGIHPGYGFLSENAAFATAVEQASIKFIGPSPHSIRMMGSKLAAKTAAKEFNIPLVPGTDKPIENVEEAEKIAAEIGYPVLIKASAGGGGKGMRIVWKKDDFREQMERAVSEAQSAFGDGSVFIEKYVSSPRHIEFQILADQLGHVVHLFERECSVQRRHQKVIEEAPCAIMTPDLRKKMGADAVKVALSCQYEGAGTVEFLMDADRNYYFLEMNTRLQVEHPVTEMITGIDLVEQQINIAKGLPLPFDQSDLSISGHAIETRVYAEDPLNDFLPSIGTLTRYSPPAGEGIRLDDGYEEGMEIPIYYDPMIAKLVTKGDNRIAAIKKMDEAIRKYKIEGISTTLPFGLFVMRHDSFRSGNFDTHFVSDFFTPEKLRLSLGHEMELAAKIALAHYLGKKDKLKIPKLNSKSWLQRK